MVLVLAVGTPDTGSLLVNKVVHQETVAAWAAVTHSSEQCGTHCFTLLFELL